MNVTGFIGALFGACMVFGASVCFASSDAAARDKKVEDVTHLTEIRVRVGNASEAREGEQMHQLILHLLGQPVTPELAKEAESILGKTGRYRSAVCRFGKGNAAGRMTCGLTRSRIIRFIRTEGLPPSY